MFDGCASSSPWKVETVLDILSKFHWIDKKSDVGVLIVFDMFINLVAMLDQPIQEELEEILATRGISFENLIQGIDDMQKFYDKNPGLKISPMVVFPISRKDRAVVKS